MQEEYPDDLQADSNLFEFGSSDNVWHDLDEVVPDTQIPADLLIERLLLEGKDLPDHCLALQGQVVSKLVLTISAAIPEPPRLNPYYQIGFFDGNNFRDLDGYTMYPTPTHWRPLPKPPMLPPSMRAEVKKVVSA